MVKNENLDNRKDTRYSFNNIFLLKNETTKKFKIVIFFHYRKKQLEKFIKDNAIDNSLEIAFYYIERETRRYYGRNNIIYDGITISVEPFNTKVTNTINKLTIDTLFDEVEENINDSLFKQIMSDYTKQNQDIQNRKDNIYYKYKGSNGTYVQELIDGYFTYVSPRKFNDPFDCDLYISSSNCKDSLRVLCLTPVMNSITMWGYYANNHDGVCVGHTLDDYLSITIHNYSGLIIYGKINYKKTRPCPKCNGKFNPNNIYFIIKIIKNCFTKYIGWKEEKEFRILTCINGFEENLNYQIKGNDYINLKGTTAELYLGVNYTYNHVLPPFAKQLKKDMYKYKLNV